jgi:hypothetical protein
MDIAGPVGRAVLGIRLLPSWASRATDGIPCVVLSSQSLPFPSRRLASLQALPFQETSSLYLHSFVFFGIARPLNARSRANSRSSRNIIVESCFVADSSIRHNKPTYPPQPSLSNNAQV